jgi:hypothetical protein
MAVILTLLLLLATSAMAGPVSHFGRLEVCGNNICAEGTTTPVLLKGPSLYWSDGTGSGFYNLETVDFFVDNMQIGVIRAAMAIRYYKDGTGEIKTTGGTWGHYFDATTQENLIRKVIDAAILNDIYVIVDWHSHNAHDETTRATDFFKKMANEYKDVPNIIWEVYNEPVNASLAQITSHSKTIVNALRGLGNKNLVLVGSPSYSKQPSSQASNYGTATQAQSDNVAFTFHFYAASHGYPNGDGIGNQANSARTAGYAVFGSEWGTVNYDGNGSVNSSASDLWTTFMDNNNISNCMWNASSLNEGSSMFTTGTTINNLATSRLTASGQYFQTYMGKNKWTGKIPDGHPKGNDVVKSVKDGESITLTSTDLGLTGNITEVNNSGFGTVTNTANSITYTASGGGTLRGDRVRFVYKTTQGSVVIQNRVTMVITERRPALPEKAPIAASRRDTTMLHLQVTLGASSEGTMTLGDVSISPSSVGTVTKSGFNIIFTPDASLYNTEEPVEATLNYSASNNNGSNSSSVTLKIQNLPPLLKSGISATYAPTTPNTESVGIGIVGVGKGRFTGEDPDGDDLWFEEFYLPPGYPGTWEYFDEKKDSVIYYPEPGKKGRVSFLAVITDGSLTSNVGRINFTLTGNVDDDDIGNLPVPKGICGYDGYDDEEECSITVISLSASKTGGTFGLKSLGLGKVGINLERSSSVKLDVFSLSGKNMGTLLNGHQNAGSQEISLKSLNLQKGIYILRLRQGSQVKTLRVVQ